jgi:hypothetical protein
MTIMDCFLLRIQLLGLKTTTHDNDSYMLYMGPSRMEYLRGYFSLCLIDTRYISLYILFYVTFAFVLPFFPL